MSDWRDALYFFLRIYAHDVIVEETVLIVTTRLEPDDIKPG